MAGGRRRGASKKKKKRFVIEDEYLLAAQARQRAAEFAEREAQRMRDDERRKIRDLRAPRFAEGSPLSYADRAILYNFSPGPVYDTSRPIGVPKRGPMRETMSRAPRPNPLDPPKGRARDAAALPAELEGLTEAARAMIGLDAREEGSSGPGRLRPRVGVTPADWNRPLVPLVTTERVRARCGSAASSMSVCTHDSLSRAGSAALRRADRARSHVDYDELRPWRRRPAAEAAPRSQEELLATFAQREQSTFSRKRGEVQRLVDAKVRSTEATAMHRATIEAVASSADSSVVYEDPAVEQAAPLSSRSDYSWWSSSSSSRGSSPR